MYYAPPDSKLNIYKEYIESLPLNDLPEIFGLHDNANINYQNQESTRVISTVPAILDRKDGDKDIFTTNSQGLLPSLTTVLLQEMEKFNRLLTKMR